MVGGQTYQSYVRGAEHITVFNTQNYVDLQNDYLSDFKCLYPDYDEVAIKNALQQTFSFTRRQQLKEEIVTVIYFILPQTGQVKELEFILPFTTQITPQELLTFETNLKTLSFPQNPICNNMAYVATTVRISWIK